jgi:hypothetical protein
MQLILLKAIWFYNQSDDTQKELEQFRQTKFESITNENSEALNFDFQNFEIKKGELGEIKIGMTISEVEQKFKGL